MSRYSEGRAAIWMLQVRLKGGKSCWSCTGAHWHVLRKDCKSEYVDLLNGTSSNCEYFEYRIMKYVPEPTADAR